MNTRYDVFDKYLLLGTLLDNTDKFLALDGGVHHSSVNKALLCEKIKDVLEDLDDEKSDQGKKDKTL